MYSHFTYQMADALNYYSTKKWLFYPVIQGKKEYAFVNDVSKSVIEKGFYSGIAPHFTEKDTRYEARIDSTDAHLILQATRLSYSPLTENAFFVVNCNGLQYYFPASFDRSWKDMLKFRVRQETAMTVIDWKAINEPCLKLPDAIRLAILKNGYVTYYPLSVIGNRATK
ncbi:hypothetical protein GO730_24740 [Spirosoma sp. HMF3257]|nr:hypothetical protein [Spirosoma telluris]